MELISVLFGMSGPACENFAGYSHAPHRRKPEGDAGGLRPDRLFRPQKGAGDQTSPTARSAAMISACRFEMASPIGGPLKRLFSMANQMISAMMNQPPTM